MKCGVFFRNANQDANVMVSNVLFPRTVYVTPGSGVSIIVTTLAKVIGLDYVYEYAIRGYLGNRLLVRTFPHNGSTMNYAGSTVIVNVPALVVTKIGDSP